MNFFFTCASFWGTLIGEKVTSQDHILLKHSLALVHTWIPWKQKRLYNVILNNGPIANITVTGKFENIL